MARIRIPVGIYFQRPTGASPATQRGEKPFLYLLFYFFLIVFFLFFFLFPFNLVLLLFLLALLS